jgi:cytosine/adenosine deaminase-related metal-dependent hydrolase
LDEARALRDLALKQGYAGDDLDRRIVEAMTLCGAAALGLTEGPDRVGRLEEGVRADFAVFSVVPVSSEFSEASGALSGSGGNVYRDLIDHGSCVATVLGGRIVHRAV